jgi:methyltransferase (TIGR00027 family)
MADSLKRPSRTAVMAAVGRALHRDGPEPHVLDDWLASDLAGGDGQSMLEGMRQKFTPERLLTFQSWTAARSRFVEDVVLEAVTNGIRQYVILGAGLDSFAYRNPELGKKLHVIEVDHPCSQLWKQRRLEALRVPVPENVSFVSVDFEKQSLRDALSTAGFAFDAPAVISWIGVTMYLALDAIEATLKIIATCAPGTILVLSYDQPPEVLDDKGRALLNDVRHTADSYGEPFITLFRQEEIELLLVQRGFTNVRHFGVEEASREYFGSKDMQMPNVQRLVVTAVGR